MIKISVIILIVTILLSFLLGITVDSILRYLRQRKNIIYGGKILVDLNRDTLDVISIKDYKNISKWHHYKRIIFDTEVNV